MGESISHAPLASPIRWAGSKRKLLPILSSMWRPSDRRYIEAFAGSACLYFNIRPEEALLNDANADLISAYTVLAKNPVKLHTRLLSIPVDAATYGEIRASKPSTKFESAVRFFYLNRYCFNGIYRTNKLGAFNVPFGRRTGGFPSIGQWRESSKALRGAQLHSGDFESVVRENVREGDFVYLDPPYAVSNRRVFTQYSANEFGIDDLRRLRSVMDHIDAVGATFVVSYALSKETKVLSDGWFSFRTLAQRNVAGFSQHRRKAVEVIVTNDENRLKVRKKDARPA